MASASVNAHASTTETTNYARLCRLLVDVGTKVLREKFDEIHPPGSLHVELLSHPVRASLERLYKGKYKILNPKQWEKLYPSCPSSVSSRNFDVTLLTVLLRYVSGLNPPTTGWNRPPPATDTSTEADIIRVRVFRNEIHGHASKAYIDNHTFDGYWQDIRQTLIRLGGDRYGPFIDKLKVDCMDPDIELHYRELLKQWIEDESKIDHIEGNVQLGCLYAETEDISLLEPTVDFKSMSKQGTTKAALRTVINRFKSLRKRRAPVCSRAGACGTKANPLNKELNLHEVSAKDGVNRIKSEMFHTQETRKANEIVVAELDEAINLQQSDHIAGAREKLQCVFETVRNLGQRFFSNRTKDSLTVLSRGKELFFEDSVSCSVKHGTLLLDSSNSGAQFYSALLNVIGAFATVISEFKMAQETFSLLIDFHRQSDETSRKQDLGAAYNNRGCISLILGDLKQAECDFKASMRHLQLAMELHQQYSPLLERMSIAINSNIGQLHVISRNYSKALEKQVKLVETCKSKEVNGLPLQVVFTLLNNLAVLYTTLGKFSKAEQELKWMVSYCYKMNREDCDYLLNFVALHRSEVLLFHGKPKEAEKAFTLDVDDIDLVEMFGGLHINVRIETVEKLVDLIVLKGKIRFACELLETGVNILKSIFGLDHFNVASLLYKQGTVLALAGEVSSAVEKFKCSMKILEGKFGIKHPLLLKCYKSLGELALRSKLADESYFYFQRVMENIEAIYLVSFVNQLSRTYLGMTNSNDFQQRTMSEDTHKIEGLVAEHGLVLAVLLSRPVVQDDTLPFRSSNPKIDQPIASNDRGVHCSYSIEVTFFKYTRDFLQTGQAFLRQGMKKEAATFFQHAKKYCTALDTPRGPTYACITRLYDVLTKGLLASRQTLKNKYEMTSCLEELSEVNAKSKGSTEEVPTATASATVDDQLNLKLVLIFLILLSIELKMMDMTFAAYDLYSRISQNEDGFLHVLNGANQFYVSKTLVTCNGKTALQDVIVSTVTFTENGSKRPPRDKELYRSLALKKNVPSDSFLVAYTSSVFLDIEELRALDQKISLSVQDCFTQKCFETGVENSATQVVVDLTTTTYTRDYRNGLLIGSRMELLSLCLLQGATPEIPQGGNISEISTAMYLKKVRLTFEDEHTSHFMFSKNALYLLQQFNCGKISTLSVQQQCLSLTITHPIKARLTLWRKDKSISQKVQFVQTATRHGVADRTVQRQRCSEEVLQDVGVAERVFGPTIDHLANAYQVPCITDVGYSDELPDVSDVHCEQRGFRLDGWQPKERQAFRVIREQSECLRNNLNATILEGLTILSELSSELYGDTIHEGEDDIVVHADADAENVRCLPTKSQSQIEREITSSDCHLQPLTLNPEANIQNRNLSLETANSDGGEVTPGTCETYPIPKEEEEDDNLLGRSLFEKDRDSRRSCIIELHHEITTKSNVMNEQDGPLGEVTQQADNNVIGLQTAGKFHTTSSRNHFRRMDISNSCFETSSTSSTELRTQTLIEPRSNQGPKTDEKAMERHLNEKETTSKGASIAKLNGPKMEEILPTWNEKVSENEGSAEDQGFHENEQFESSSIPGQSRRRVKEVVKQSLTDATIDYSITHDGIGNTTSDYQYQSNSLSSTHGQTQHQHDVQRKTKHAILKEGKGETVSPMVIREEYIFQRRDERESGVGQDELLVNEGFAQFFTTADMKKRETCRSPFNVYEHTVPDGAVSETSSGIHNSSIDSSPSRNIDVIDGLLKRSGNDRRVESLNLPENATRILTSRRQFVDETCYKELLPGRRRNEKLQKFEENGEKISFRTPQFPLLGDDGLVDGGTTDSLRKEEEEFTDGPILTGGAFTTCQDGTEGIFENDFASFQSNTATDVVDGPVYSPKRDASVNDPQGFGFGFGGARPKEKSRKSTRRNSLIKTKMTEPKSIFQPNVTGEIGLKPGFLERHTIKSNGVMLDLPSHDGRDEPYFSAQSCKSITYGDHLRLLGEGINPPGYTSSSSSQGFYEQAAFAVTTSTPGNAQSLAINQKPSLNQKESWHFPCLESPNGDQGLRQGQQNPSQSRNSIIPNVEALFGNHGSRSTYDEMDSMSQEYQNSMGNVDNRMVKSPAVNDSDHSSTEDSTFSLLGSLQQIMSKTINLIASSDAVAKQPQKEPKEAVKLSIQEEARGSSGQEQAVKIGVENSRNQEESTQDNGETESQPIQTPVQETPRPVCSHYQRRCLVRFPCCGKFYPCHRCHNESKDCSDDQARASNATHIRCSICYHEQVIDEKSQTCGGCKSKMSEYFCSTCKHFTSVDKNPFHCDKCGICRIHRDRSFHCDVCNVCLDKRLQGKHKCRPDSGHDECCICLEDAFSGCQILPCSHKVHKDCAIAMIQNGVRSCPICRHPLFSQTQNRPQ